MRDTSAWRARGLVAVVFDGSVNRVSPYAMTVVGREPRSAVPGRMAIVVAAARIAGQNLSTNLLTVSPAHPRKPCGCKTPVE